MIKIGELLRKLWSLWSCFLILPPGTLTPQGLKVRWSVTWANIGVPSIDVPAEVELLHMRIERHEGPEVFCSLWNIRDWTKMIWCYVSSRVNMIYDHAATTRTQRCHTYLTYGVQSDCHLSRTPKCLMNSSRSSQARSMRKLPIIVNSKVIPNWNVKWYFSQTVG